MEDVIQEPTLNLKVNTGSNVSRNGIVTIIKGDSLYLNLVLNIGTPLVPIYFQLEPEDKVVFKVFYPNDGWNDAILTKTGTSKDVKNNIISYMISPEDTEFINAGQYYYQVKIFYTRDDVDHVITLIPRTKFYVLN